jgi:ABC-2 type transport system ATP-binding protein
MCAAPRCGIVAVVIEVNELTKRYRDAVAVDELSFTVQPGTVTGFLGPNGAGKTTTMRVLLGLVAPTAGEALVRGRPYASFNHPLREVGALLDANAVHPGRSAVEHLRWLARTNGIGAGRVADTLDQVGLTDAARTRVGRFSLGMRQRLGIAAALLGDPGVLIFDEPVNGLDPQGVRWIRELMRSLAAEGRTVLISNHLMSEMELTADRLVIIGRGRLLLDTTIGELITTEGFTTLEDAYLSLTDEWTVHRAGGERR